jgi:Ca2+-binding RTX toxin-like protein
VLLNDYFGSSLTAGKGLIETIQFKDGSLSLSDVIARVNNPVVADRQRPDTDEPVSRPASDGTIRGTAAADLLKGGAGQDRILGGDGGDNLQGGAGNDQLLGEAGNDRLEGGDGDDLLDGGLGNDVLVGGLGNDAYVYRAGEGMDQIQDAGGAADRLELSNLTLQSVKMSVLGGTSLLLDAGAGNRVLINDFFTVGQNGSLQAGTGLIESIQFQDGTLNFNQVVQQLTPLTPSTPTSPGNPAVGTPGQGQVVARPPQPPTPPASQPPLAKEPGSDGTLLGTAGGDILKGTAQADTIFAGEGMDNVQGGDGDDQLFGEAGNDRLDGGAGNDLLVGGQGNDTLAGGLGNDTYYLGSGDGLDQILDDGGTADVLDLTAFNPSQLKFTALGGNMLQIDAGDGNRFLVNNYFTTPATPGGSLRAGSGLIETIRLQDGTLSFEDISRAVAPPVNPVAAKPVTPPPPAIPTTPGAPVSGSPVNQGTVGSDLLRGTAGNDEIRAGAGADNVQGGDGNDRLFGESGNDRLEGANGNDFLDGGQGNDMLLGGLGDDTYRIGMGDGADQIVDDGGANDVLDLSEFNRDQIAIKALGGPALLIETFGGHRVMLNNYFGSTLSQSGSGLVETIQLKDGSLSFSDVSRLVAPTAPNPVHGNTPGTQPGQPQPAPAPAPVDETVKHGTGGSDLLRGTTRDDQLYGRDGADNLQGGDGNDQLLGEGGNDRVEGGTGNDLLDGGTGNDILVGGLGDDTYRFRAGDGSDSVSDEGGANDLLDLSTFNRNEFRVSKFGGTNLLLEAGEGNRIVLNNFFSSATGGADRQAGSGLIETLQFKDGSLSFNEVKSWLAETEQAQNAGDAVRSDIISDSHGTDDVLDLQSFTRESVTYRAVNTTDLQLDLGNGNQIVVKDYFTATSNATNGFEAGTGLVETIRFSNGSMGLLDVARQISPNAAVKVGDTWYGSEGNNVMNGTSGNDRISAAGGEDRLAGGAGNDLLEGGSGNDTYTGFSRGFGSDTIIDVGPGGSGVADRLDLSAFTLSDVTSWEGLDTTQDGMVDSLRMQFVTGDSLTVLYYFDNTSANPDLAGAGEGMIEQIAFADDPSVDLTQVQGLIA